MNINPSYPTGFAHNKAECVDKYKWMWDGLVAAFVPFLGPDGSLRNIVTGIPSVLTNMDATDWERDALNFPGTNEHVHIPTPVVSSYPLTVTAWFNVANTVDLHTILSISDASAGDVQLAVFADGGVLAADRVVAAVRNAGLFSRAASATTFTANKWFFVAAVFTNATLREVYLNAAGKGTDTDSDAFPASADVTDIGRLGDSSPSSYLTGQLRNVYIYNKSLNESEIIQHYHNPRGLFVRKPSISYFVAPAVAAGVEIFRRRIEGY